MKKRLLRIATESIVGILASTILFSFVIYFGYTEASARNSAITIFGLEIFNFENGTETPNSNNMMILGSVCSFLFVIIGEFLFGRKKNVLNRAT